MMLSNEMCICCEMNRPLVGFGAFGHSNVFFLSCAPFFHVASAENLLVGTNGSSFGDPDATSRASQVTGSSHDRTTRVAFAADTQDRTGDTDVEVCDVYIWLFK